MKQTIQLNETSLKSLIREAIEELSPELLTHASNMADAKGRDMQSCNLYGGAIRAFNRDYGWKGVEDRKGNFTDYALNGGLSFSEDENGNFIGVPSENDLKDMYNKKDDYAMSNLKPNQRNKYFKGKDAKDRMRKGLKPDGTPYDKIDEVINKILKRL